MADTCFVGLELNEREVRMCVYDTKEKDAVTVMVTVGGKRAECPAHMAYQEENGQWKYGIEADYFASQKGCILFDDILERAKSAKAFEVNGKSFPCEEVLAEFLKQALLLAGIKAPALQMHVLMVTVPQITRELTKVTEAAFKRLGLGPNQAFLQSFDESFFYHTYYQKKEVFTRDTGIFYFPDENSVIFKKMHADHATKPITVTVSDRRERELSLKTEERDKEFGSFIKECIGEEDYSSFFLVGKGFDREWSKESLGLLCKAHRKVFYGNNLFSKGACFGAREKTSQAELKNLIFLGGDLVRKNIGIEMLVDGIAMYYPLVTAGVHWYEAENSCELLLNDEKNLVFRVSRMEDGKKTNYSMALPGLLDRPAKTTRLRVKLQFETAQRCLLTVQDLGFGELFPSSGMSWTETL